MNQRFEDVAAPYAACFAIIKRDGKVAFVLRSQTGWQDGMYGLPAGRVNLDEPILVATAREAKEEIGVTIDLLNLEHRLTVHRKAAADDSFWIDCYFEALAWAGEPYNAEPLKHEELAWLDPQHLPENVVPAVRDALTQIAAGKTYAEFGWN